MSTIPKQLEHRELVKCEPKGKYIGNYKCHCNCLSYALRNNNVESIVGVMQVFPHLQGAAHFIVKLYDGTYIDPTYGNLANTLYDYCIVIEEYKIDTFKPNRELENLQNYLKSLRPWYLRLFTKY